MRKERLTHEGADQTDTSGSFEPAQLRAFVRRLGDLAPRNIMIIMGIVASFGMLAAYEYARLSQYEAQKLAMMAELTALKSSKSLQPTPETGAVFSVAAETSSQVEFAAPPEVGAVNDIQQDASNQMMPHFAVIGSVMAIVLLLVWQMRARPRPVAPPQLTDSREPEGVFDALNLAVAHWSPDGSMIGCNARFKNLFGDGSDIVCANVDHGRIMKALSDGATIHLIQDDEHRRVVELGNENGLALMMEERPLKSGGFVTLISDNSVAKGAAQALEDLREEQRLLAQQLREEKFRAEAASRAKTSFLAHLSHDVRTPLNHIIGFADLISHQTYGPIGDKRYLNYVNDIKGSGEKLLSSFSEILELAQIEGGQLVLRRERLSVEDILNTTANRFQDTAKRAGLEFELSAPQDGQLYGDRLCIERMLANLMDNAIQFTPAGGSVRLAGYVAEDGVVIEVTDTGIGMSEERLKDLAQPFVLGDAAFTRETSGVGLGISISRAIAELSGGMMEIDSNPAVGTTVAISLPLHAAKSEQQAA